MQSKKVVINDRVRPIILVFVKYYLPGYKSGGPVRSIANIVDKLGDEFDFRIVTSDRDWTDSDSYNGIEIDAWNKLGNTQVFYLSPKKNTFSFISKLLSVTHHDVLYLNSYFDLNFTQKPLWARRLGFVKKKPLIIAPRGEFSNGAFSFKYWIKTSYARIAAWARLYEDAVWHASTIHEASDIKHCLTVNSYRQALSKIMVASDIASNIDSNIDSDSDVTLENERPHVLRIVFISRISPKKNLDFALRVLAQVQTNVEFNIYGPNGGDDYWRHCNYLIKRLPANVKVVYMGVLKNSEVMKVFRAHDLFLFPTRGENYGHVIMEAMSAGTPVLLANTTPWRNLELFGVGWDLPLDNELDFVKKIEFLSKTSFEDRMAQRQRVYSYAKTKSHEPDVIENNRNLFRFAVDSGKIQQTQSLGREADRSDKSCAEL